MKILNPYFYQRVATGERFIGRASELELLKAYILDTEIPRSCSIVGETRIGKSSLLRKFIEIARQERPDFLILNYDMSSSFQTGSTVDFYRQFIARISRDLASIPELDHAAARMAADPGLPAQLVSEQIESFFASVGQHNSWLLLVLDEFDYTTEHFKFGPQGWKLLRALANDLGFALSYLFASRRPIAVLEEDAGISSNLASIFETMRLRLMPEQEVLDLFAWPASRAGVPWSEAEQALAARVAGGHPYCVQMIGSHFFQWRAQDTLAEVQDELHVIQRLCNSYRHLFDLQRRRLDPQGNFDVLVKIAHGVPVIATDRQIDELVDLGYLLCAEETRDHFRPFSLALDLYLKAYGMQTELWPLMEKSEAALQALVKNRYQQAFGDAWVDELPLSHPAADSPTGTLDLLRKWEETRKEIQNNPFITIDKRSHLIQYASWLDLKLLIQDHYELFQDVFPDRRQLDSLLDPLHNARTRASCYRRVSEYAAEQLETICQRLLDALYTASSPEIAHPQPVAEAETVSVGATIEGKYKILDLVGWSDRSNIFKAWEIPLKRYVAIKVLLPDAQASPEEKALQKDRLTREALIVAGLEDHPHIVSIYTALPQFPAIVMPWYEHTELSLEAMIRDDENDIPLPWLVTLGLQLADALDCIHSKGITHRDLKPANILLNKKQEPVLIDFDIARASNVGTITRGQYGKPFYVGSARYSAPEQFLLGMEVGPYTDIFALGVVLYQAQTHQFPFPLGNNPANYRDSLLPTPERADMPARLYEILCATLNQKPAQRPIAKTLREQLQEYLRTIEII
jgi:hypothetical protein